MRMATKIDLSKVQEAMPDQPGMGMGSDITKPFKGFPADKIRYIETRTEDDVKVHVFEASPSMPGQASPGHPTAQMLPKKIRLMISADSGLPHKMQMLADDGSMMMQQTYSNIRINIPVDDSEFDFVPPEDVQVMDMTQGAMNMMQQMQGSGTKSQ
jgi:outer membrane lipoprotein-sorting protein